MFITEIKNKKVVLYSLSEVATILNRKRITIVKWIEYKYIPTPFFLKSDARHNFITKKNGMQIKTYAEQEVNALIGLLEKWDIQKWGKISRVKGFIQEVWTIFDEIRANIMNGKIGLTDYGFLLKFENREEAEEVMKVILKEVKRPEQTINELAAAIVRELIMRRDVNLTKGIANATSKNR